MAWPAADAPIAAQELVWPEGAGVVRVYLDAGHGAAGNSGNTSAFCEAEQDGTLRVAEGLERRLEATGRFEVELSRRGDARVPYAERVAAAKGYDVFVSLHSDARLEGLTAVPTWENGGRTCPHKVGAAGFSVLWSDEGALASARQTLAEAVAERMIGAGFAPYGGADYVGAYEPTAEGVFVDRHAPEKRILVLRRPTIPSILIETHHAWDPEEATRWTEDRTLDAFAAALAGALSSLR